MARPNIFATLATQEKAGATYINLSTGSFVDKTAVDATVDKAFMSDLASNKLDRKNLDYEKYATLYTDAHFTTIEKVRNVLNKELGMEFPEPKEDEQTAPPTETQETVKEEKPTVVESTSKPSNGKPGK